MLDVTPLMPLNAASADTRELQELAGRPAAIVLHYRNRTCRITLSLSPKHEPSRSKVQSTRRNELFAASVTALILSNRSSVQRPANATRRIHDLTLATESVVNVIDLLRNGVAVRRSLIITVQ